MLWSWFGEFWLGEVKESEVLVVLTIFAGRSVAVVPVAVGVDHEDGRNGIAMKIWIVDRMKLEVF